MYNLSINNISGYTTIGGLIHKGHSIVSYFNFDYEDIPPSTISKKRDSSDTKEVFQKSVYGNTIDSAGIKLASDSIGRVGELYKLYKMLTFSADEIPLDVATDIVVKAAKQEANLLDLNRLIALRNDQDITKDAVIDINSRIRTLITELNSSVINCSLTNVTGGISIVANGMIATSSVQYSYKPVFGFGQLNCSILESI